MFLLSLIQMLKYYSELVLKSPSEISHFPIFLRINSEISLVIKTNDERPSLDLMILRYITKSVLKHFLYNLNSNLLKLNFGFILNCYIYKNNKDKCLYLSKMHHQISALILFGDTWFQLPKWQTELKSLKDDRRHGNLQIRLQD